MIGLLYTVLFFFITLGCGWTITRWLERGTVYSVPERWVVSYCLGCLFFYLAVFAVGPFLYDRTSMLAVLALGAVIALPAWRSWNLRLDLSAIRHQTLILWAVIAGILALSMIEGLAPVSDFDSLNYHLSLPLTDLEQGYLGPNWTGMHYSFFPELCEHLYRIALAVGGPAAPQLVSGLFGPMVALATAAIALRMGFSATIAALAALMVVGLRVVAWELTTCYVDMAVTTFTSAALLTLMRWRNGGGRSMAILFGLLIGEALLTKYHGLAIGASFAPVILWDVAKGRIRLAHMFGAVAVAVLTFAPHAARDFYYTGNPVYPLFNSLFHPGQLGAFEGVAGMLGRGLSLLDFLRVPWDISILPTYYFDGMELGAPYLLVFLPFAVLIRPRPILPLVCTALVYAILWFWFLTQQIRFLLPIAPMVAVLAAAGAAEVWARSQKWARAVIVGGSVILAANQAMFIGIYAVTRLPAALGRMDAMTYLTDTPGLDGGSFYGACTFVKQRLGKDEKVVLMLNLRTYYCPQTQAIISPYLPEEQDYWATGTPLPPLTPASLADELARHHVRYVVMAEHLQVRSGPASKPEDNDLDYSGNRLGRFIAPIAQNLPPLYRDKVSAVFDGPAIIAALLAGGD